MSYKSIKRRSSNYSRTQETNKQKKTQKTQSQKKYVDLNIKRQRGVLSIIKLKRRKKNIVYVNGGRVIAAVNI